MQKALFSKQLILTVSTQTHEILDPQWYRYLINPHCQYQLIPTTASQFIEDPWEHILSLLPLSSNTLIDVCLPYKEWRGLEAAKEYQKGKDRLLGRYFLYRGKVIAIKICTQRFCKAKQRYESVWPANVIKRHKLPPKICDYLSQHSRSAPKTVQVGDFYLTTNKFKVLPLFESEIRALVSQTTERGVSRFLRSYLELGCEIVSVMNNEEYPLRNFAIDYGRLVPSMGQSDSQSDAARNKMLVDSRKALIELLRAYCESHSIVMMYCGCKTAPNTAQIFYTNPFIQVGELLTESVVNQFECLEARDLSKSGAVEAASRLNVFELVSFERLRKTRRQAGSLHADNDPAWEELDQKNGSQPSEVRLDFSEQPINVASTTEVEAARAIKYRDQAWKENRKYYSGVSAAKGTQIFRSVQISGESLAKTMHLFNFLISCLSGRPLVMGVPFTRVSRNIFGSIAYIYDSVMRNQQNEVFKKEEHSEVGNPGPKQQSSKALSGRPRKIGSLLDLVQFFDCSRKQSSRAAESSEPYREMIGQILGASNYQIPDLATLLRQMGPGQLFFCADDEEERQFIEKTVQQKCNSPAIFPNALLNLQVFQTGLDLRPSIEKECQEVLSLEQSNLLEKYSLTLREGPPANTRHANRPQHAPVVQQMAKEILKQKGFESLADLLIHLHDSKFPKEYLRDLLIDKLAPTFRKRSQNGNLIRTFTTMADIQIIELAHRMYDEFEESENFERNLMLIDDSSEDGKHSETQRKRLNAYGRARDLDEILEKNYSQKLEKCIELKQQYYKSAYKRCHRCDFCYPRSESSKCEKCLSYFCLSCLHDLADDTDGPKSRRSVQLSCTVCKKTCECDMCVRSFSFSKTDTNGQKLTQESNVVSLTTAEHDVSEKSSAARDPRVRAKVPLSSCGQKQTVQMPELMIDESDRTVRGLNTVRDLNFAEQSPRISQPRNDRTVDQTLADELTFQKTEQEPLFRSINSDVMSTAETIDFDGNQKGFYKPFENCTKCQHDGVDIENHPRIRIECMLCEAEECYNCVLRLYEAEGYQPFGRVQMYWKCTSCDKKYTGFVKKKKMQETLQMSPICNQDSSELLIPNPDMETFPENNVLSQGSHMEQLSRHQVQPYMPYPSTATANLSAAQSHVSRNILIGNGITFGSPEHRMEAQHSGYQKRADNFAENGPIYQNNQKQGLWKRVENSQSTQSGKVARKPSEKEIAALFPAPQDTLRPDGNQGQDPSSRVQATREPSSSEKHSPQKQVRTSMSGMQKWGPNSTRKRRSVSSSSSASLSSSSESSSSSSGSSSDSRSRSRSRRSKKQKRTRQRHPRRESRQRSREKRSGPRGAWSRRSHSGGRSSSRGGPQYSPTQTRRVRSRKFSSSVSSERRSPQPQPRTQKIPTIQVMMEPLEEGQLMTELRADPQQWNLTERQGTKRSSASFNDDSDRQNHRSSGSLVKIDRPVINGHSHSTGRDSRSLQSSSSERVHTRTHHQRNSPESHYQWRNYRGFSQRQSGHSYQWSNENRKQYSHHNQYWQRGRRDWKPIPQQRYERSTGSRNGTTRNDSQGQRDSSADPQGRDIWARNGYTRSTEEGPQNGLLFETVKRDKLSGGNKTISEMQQEDEESIQY